MRVHQILNSKSDDGVVTIKPGTSVESAAQLLAEKRIGAVIVSDDGEVAIGILSERDVVRELGKRGASCMSDMVDDLMTADPISCTMNEDSSEVFQKMTEGRFRHLPVIEDGKMVGLISIGDVVKAQLSTLSMEKDALQGMIMGY
ncbi:CBS domain-containing protein [Meridianimarinicoccus sp. MJW13]|uniref:CBS domain-containing protein n=1 Tax=Meridianimarinicoccus sp. MJW13 TaxID=2720031 RepID=UPI00186826DF|nr:CBS domain-containing protein [Fluviibacterium sp. MJW13]